MNEEKIGIWSPEKIDADELQDFADWLNNWADFRKHKECSDGNKFTEFGKGYNKAIGDVIEKLGLDFKYFDRRTKTGFKK